MPPTFCFIYCGCVSIYGLFSFCNFIFMQSFLNSSLYIYLSPYVYLIFLPSIFVGKVNETWLSINSSREKEKVNLKPVIRLSRLIKKMVYILPMFLLVLDFHEVFSPLSHHLCFCSTISF